MCTITLVDSVGSVYSDYKATLERLPRMLRRVRKHYRRWQTQVLVRWQDSRWTTLPTFLAAHRAMWPATAADGTSERVFFCRAPLPEVPHTMFKTHTPFSPARVALSKPKSSLVVPQPPPSPPFFSDRSCCGYDVATLANSLITPTCVKTILSGGWDEQSIAELLCAGARPPLDHCGEVIQFPNCRRVQCSFVKPDGELCSVCLAVNLVQYAYPDATYV